MTPSLEMHLTTKDACAFLDRFVEAGSDFFLVHWEGNANLHRTVERVKTLRKQVGVAINPAAPAAVLQEILPDVDADREGAGAGIDAPRSAVTLVNQ